MRLSLAELKVVTPANPGDAIGLMAAAIRSDDPVSFFEHKGRYSSNCSLAANKCFWNLDGPMQWITTPHIPLPAADSLEDLAMPSADGIATIVEKELQT